MTIRDLWKSFNEYPERLNYYDEDNDFEGEITNQEEMSEFIDEHEDIEVVSWNYSYTGNILSINF